MTRAMETPAPDVRAVRELTDGVALDIALPETLLYFRGHFPGNPVLPGVVQVDWAVGLADLYLGTAIGAARQFQVKFRSVITPGRVVTLVLRRSSGGARLSFEFRRDDELLSSGSMAVEDGA